jgi:hypothetical protein
MAKAGYTAHTESAAVSLSAGVAKSILGVRGPSGIGVDLKKFRLGFEGVTASAVPVVVELCYCTFATNAPGTGSTSVTVNQVYGRSIAAGFTAAKNWSTEPTVVTTFDLWPLTPAGGLTIVDIPLGDTPDCAANEGFVIRLNAPATVTARATMWFERV